MPTFAPPPDESPLEELLSRPTPALVDAMRAVDGDIMILGAGGKMGPSLARLARRAANDAGRPRRIIAVARFTDGALPQALRQAGIETIAADLLDPAALAALPDAPNVIHMVGQKFGTTGDEPRTWAVNAHLAGSVAERFRNSRIVAFSTGNVYPLSSARGEGPREDEPVAPVGEYAYSALARERILEYCSRRYDTPMAILRLNYAVEPRYGVLRDIADQVWAGQPVTITMGKVNVIWQRDANIVALRALARCASPPLVLNLTGFPSVSVRWIAERFSARFRRDVRLRGIEADTALLSDANRMYELFGEPPMSVIEMIAQVGQWVEQGGRSLGKATHFEARDGRF